MHTAARPSLRADDLSTADDFELGIIRVSPASRTLQSSAGLRHLQPKVMLVLMGLARNRGKVVSRAELFATCWPAGGVGDDSLNRAVKALRGALRVVGRNVIAIETVPRTGYRLLEDTKEQTPRGTLRQAAQKAVDCWRMGLPKPDLPTIDELENLLRTSGGSAEEWGVLALLLRKTVEYAEAKDCAELVGRCEEAARQARALQRNEPNASVALAGLTPLFGNWASARSALLEVMEQEPTHVACLHDLAVLEMSTGRPSAATPLIEQLISSDALAATYHYKRMYHLWVLGDLAGAEQVAGRALALWPQHPAIWMARFWTLLFTGRADQAEHMTGADESASPFPIALLHFLRRTAQCTARGGSEEQRRTHISAALDLATRGPSQAVASLLSLYALEAVDEAFEVAEGYYLGRGKVITPLRRNQSDPSITDQHRRVSQPLFIPAAREMRKDPRFKLLCDEIGLSAYWDRFQITPDFERDDALGSN